MYQLLLDLSVVFYSILYIPQVWRNRNPERLRGVAFSWHYLLLSAVIADNIYGWGLVHAWQYVFVSGLFGLLLAIQHVQFCYLYRGDSRIYRLLVASGVAFLAMLIFGLSQLALLQQHRDWLNAIGWVERISYWLYGLPQLVRCFRSVKAALAISPTMLVLSTIAGVLNSFCAWMGSWGPSSRYGSPIAVCVHLVFLYVVMRQRKASLLSRDT